MGKILAHMLESHDHMVNPLVVIVDGKPTDIVRPVPLEFKQKLPIELAAHPPLKVIESYPKPSNRQQRRKAERTPKNNRYYGR